MLALKLHTTKKARGAGGQVIRESVGANYNLDKNSDFVKRLFDRFSEIVKRETAPVHLGNQTFPPDHRPDERIGELAWEAMTILAAEIRNFPDIAAELPEQFRQAIQSGHTDNLSAFERALLIVLQQESKDNADIFAHGEYSDYLALKMHALAAALAEEVHHG